MIGFGKEWIPLIWNEIEPFIERALDRGSVYSKEDIYHGLRDEKLQLWGDDGLRAILVTALVDDYCLLLALSGEGMNDWLHELEQVENWARGENCREMRIHGRKGWSRKLGYSITGRDELGLYIQSKRL